MKNYSKIFLVGSFVLFFFACNASGEYFPAGDYVQDTILSQSLSDFFDEGSGLSFEGPTVYEKGDFSSYRWIGGNLTESAADLLLEGSYGNIHCRLCPNTSTEALVNPSHDMKETIAINSSRLRYYESGLLSDSSEALKFAVPGNAVSYAVFADYIPMKTLSSDAGRFIDYEYRGKIVFFGQEYYVRDIIANYAMHIDRGAAMNVSNAGYTTDYEGYRFKVHNLTMSSGNCSAILLDVRKPDGSVVQLQASNLTNGVVDDLEISGVAGSINGQAQQASIIIYDLSSDILLEDGEDLEIGGEVKKDWKVSFALADNCINDPYCDIAEYEDMNPNMTDALLRSVEIKYSHDLEGDEALEKDESLILPNDLWLTFEGYQNSRYLDVANSGAGEGNIKVERGDYAHSLLIGFTGSDGKRYNRVRLDEGPFARATGFIFNGVVYNYSAYVKNQSGPGHTDDTAEVTLRPAVGGSDLKISNMQRYCNGDDDASPTDPSYTHTDCISIDYVHLRELALTDALKDDASLPITASDYGNDVDLVLDAYDIYIKKNALTIGSRSFDLIFDEADNTVFFADDFPADNSLQVNANMTGLLTAFYNSGYPLSMSVLNEAGLASDPNSQTYNASADLNKDGDDDDTLVVFTVQDGKVIADLSDRNYDGDIDSSYSNGMYIDLDSDTVKDSGDAGLDDDGESLLITPAGGDRFVLDWGADNRIEAMELYHPLERVYSTYFIGRLMTDSTTTTTTTTSTTSTSTSTTTSTTSTTIRWMPFSILGTSRGTAVGELYDPMDVEIDSRGYIYVLERVNCRVQMFNSRNVSLATYGGCGDIEAGELDDAEGLGLRETGNRTQVLVADTYNHRIQFLTITFNNDSTRTVNWSSFGERCYDQYNCNSTSRSYFEKPGDAVCDPSGRIYVADTGFNRISSFISNDYNKTPSAKNRTDYANAASSGFKLPAGVSVRNEKIYVADTGSGKIKVLSLTGSQLLSIGTGVNASGKYDLINPKGIDADARGNIYVADSGNGRIIIYNIDGQYITDFGAKNCSTRIFNDVRQNGVGQMCSPSGIRIFNESIYVADPGNQRVQAFRIPESLKEYTCTLTGDKPPCGAVTVSEVVAHINLWAAGNASLSEVIALINAWAGA